MCSNSSLRILRPTLHIYHVKLLVPEMLGKINCGMSAVNCTVHLKLQAPEMHGKCGMSAVNCAVHLKLQAPEMHG